MTTRRTRSSRPTSMPVGSADASQQSVDTSWPAQLATWRQLLLNRTSPFALQQADGSYRWIFQPCDPSVIAAHLAGEITVAVSSLDEQGGCRWLCLDADGTDGADGTESLDALAQLLRIRQHLDAVGLPSVLEQSRRGGHLWLFFDQVVPAALARRAVLGCLDQLHMVHGVDLAGLEVYPNAEHAGRLGHAVRLPSGVHRLTGKRYPFLDEAGQPVAAESIVSAVAYLVHPPRSARATLEQLAAQFPAAGDGDSGGRTAGHASGDVSPAPFARSAGTLSAVINWVDASISPLELLEEFAPSVAPRSAGQGYLGWCPFHDDQAPDAQGQPGTPSFYVVHNPRYGWSWRCLSRNCAHSSGPMRHSFRLFQELLHVDVPRAIDAARVRWLACAGPASLLPPSSPSSPRRSAPARSRSASTSQHTTTKE